MGIDSGCLCPFWEIYHNPTPSWLSFLPAFCISICRNCLAEPAKPRVAVDFPQTGIKMRTCPPKSWRWSSSNWDPTHFVSEQSTASGWNISKSGFRRIGWWENWNRFKPHIYLMVKTQGVFRLKFSRENQSGDGSVFECPTWWLIPRIVSGLVNYPVIYMGFL